ncbi:MAG: tRNA threonylcarbamoyladenosine biosynthesis protein TsaB [Bacteroidia bacterium]|jgi:tRNA threonylcarbamoyladenosine biosynthesis protein TsaB
MPTILHIESSTKTCSICVSQNGEVIAIRESCDEQYSHAEKLAVFVDEVIKEVGGPKKLDAVCVAKGPGSYTGLRIGVSAAKGLCFSLDIPLLSVTALASLTELAKVQIKAEPEDILMPMIDARRMEVYTAQFDHQGVKQTDISALVVDESTVLNESGKTYIFGDGSAKCKAVLESENVVLLEGLRASSRGMIQIAEAKFNTQEFEDVAYFEPFYLKEFVAGKPKKIF